MNDPEQKWNMKKKQQHTKKMKRNKMSEWVNELVQSKNEVHLLKFRIMFNHLYQLRNDKMRSQYENKPNHSRCMHICTFQMVFFSTLREGRTTINWLISINLKLSSVEEKLIHNISM